MRVKILGKTINIKLVSNLNWRYNGSVEPPDTPNRSIRIRKSLSDKELCDVIIHECLHVGDFDKDEEWVDELAKDITNILWKLGFRRLDKEQLKVFDNDNKDKSN